MGSLGGASVVSGSTEDFSPFFFFNGFFFFLGVAFAGGTRGFFSTGFAAKTMTSCECTVTYILGTCGETVLNTHVALPEVCTDSPSLYFLLASLKKKREIHLKANI